LILVPCSLRSQYAAIVKERRGPGRQLQPEGRREELDLGPPRAGQAP
jgi:hypothetical protein